MFDFPDEVLRLETHRWDGQFNCAGKMMRLWFHSLPWLPTSLYAVQSPYYAEGIVAVHDGETGRWFTQLADTNLPDATMITPHQLRALAMHGHLALMREMLRGASAPTAP